jgi:hypothetical protein
MGTRIPPLKVGIYDPFEAYPKIQQKLAEKVQLTNLHWRKTKSDALRSIPQLPYEIVEETPRFFDKHTPSTLSKISDGGSAMDDTLNLLRTPYTRLMFIQCDNTDVYRSQVRPLITAWKENNIKQSHCPIEWNLVFLQTDSSSKSQQRVFEKLKTDNPDVDSVDHCVLLKLTYLNNLEENESLGVLSSRLKASVLYSLSKRIEILEAALLTAKDPLLKFALKEGVSRQFLNFHLFEDALRQYSQLLVTLKSDLQLVKSHDNELKRLDSIIKTNTIFESASTEPSLFSLTSFIFSRNFLILESLSLNGSMSVSSLHIGELLKRVQLFVSDVRTIFGKSIEINEWIYQLIDDVFSSEVCSRILRTIDQDTDESLLQISDKFGELLAFQRSVLLLLGSSLKGYQINGILTDVLTAEFSEAEIRNEELKRVLSTREQFESKFFELTESAIRHFGLAGRPRAVDALSIDIALLDYQNSQYEKAALVLSNCPEYYGSQGWKFIGYSLLETYIDCLEHMDANDEFFTTPKESVLAENYVSLLSSMKEGSVVSSGSLENTLDKLTRLELTGSSTKEIKYGFDELFTVDVKPYVTPLGSDTYSINLSLKNSSGLELKLKDLRLSMVNENTNKVIFSAPEATLDTMINTVELKSSNVSIGDFKIESISAKFGPISLFQEFSDKPETTIFASPNDLEIKLDHSTRLNLGIKTFSVFIKTFEDISDVNLRFNQLGGFLELDDSIILFQGDNLLHKFSDTEDLRYPILEALNTYELVIPFKQHSVASKLMELFVEVKFFSSDGVLKSQSITDHLDTTLKVEISVQDIFKFNSLYTKFSIGTSDANIPIRIIDVDLKSGGDYNISTALKPQEAVAFAEQPGNYFFKLDKTNDLKVNNNLLLSVEYRDLSKEISTVWKAILWQELKRANFQIFYRLIIDALTLEVDYTAYELDSVITFINKRFNRSILKYIPFAKERSEIENILHKFLSETHPRAVPDTSANNQHLAINVPIPTVELLQEYELKLEHSKIYTTLGDELYSKLTIKSILSKHESTTAKKVSFRDQISNKYEIEIIPNNDAWLINGQTKFSFEVHKNSEDNKEEDFKEKTFDLCLIPLKVGKLTLPRIKITKEDISFKLDEYALEIDYKNENETIYVVSEKA